MKSPTPRAVVDNVKREVLVSDVLELKLGEFDDCGEAESGWLEAI
jgi:hypothetical protein